MNSSTRTRLSAFLFLGLSAVVLADPPRERGRHSGHGRVILYTEADFRGDSIVLHLGDQVQDFAREQSDRGGTANDRVSSILVEGNLELIAYADSHYRGDSLHVSESVSNLADLPGPSRRGNWNDLISSAAVEKGKERPRRGGGGGDRDRFRRREVSGPRVELYSDANFRGPRMILVPGDRVSNLADVGFDDDSEANDSVSSIRVIGDASITLYSDGEFRGSKIRISESVPNLALRSGRDGSRSWNDSVSSVAVGEKDNRRPEDVVTKAYRDILKRDPDEGGLAVYAQKMRDEGWTEEDVRESLRNSDEGRDVRRRRRD